MSAIDRLEFISEEGEDIGKNLTVYALSTCGFCKAALRYLRKKKIAFKYVYMDNLPEGTKKMVKAELSETYGERPMYPFLVIDGSEHIVGYDEKEWDQKLGMAE